MRDSDWSREILLRSDWLVPRVAPITTATSCTVEFWMLLGGLVSSQQLEVPV